MTRWNIFSRCLSYVVILVWAFRLAGPNFRMIVFPESDLIIVRLGRQKGPKKNRFGSQSFHDYIQEGFEMIKNVTQP